VEEKLDNERAFEPGYVRRGASEIVQRMFLDVLMRAHRLRTWYLAS
jgi:hypothetical protein